MIIHMEKSWIKWGVSNNQIKRLRVYKLMIVNEPYEPSNKQLLFCLFCFSTYPNFNHRLTKVRSSS